MNPHEKNEISAVYPEVVEKLRGKIEEWYPVGN